MLGWSDGAKVALVMANKYSYQIKAVVLMGIITFATERGTKNILATKNTKYWDQEMLNNYLRAYKDEEEIQSLWSRHMDFIANFGRYFPNGLCNNDFSAFRCPVLIVHGDLVCITLMVIWFV